MTQQDTTSIRVARTPFAMIPRWLVRSSISDRAVRLYALLTEYAHRGGDVARADLAADLGCSTRSVDRALRELEDAGGLQVFHRYQGSRQLTSKYRPLFDQPDYDPDADDGDAADTGGGAGATPVTHQLRETGDGEERETRASNGTLFGDDPQPRKRRRKPERPIPDGWTPDENLRSWCASHTPGVDVDHEAGRFVDHALSVDRRARDWSAAFRNWMRKAAERTGPNRGRADSPGRRFEGAESHDAGYWTPDGAAMLLDEEDHRG